ncbi:unnamed protein product [Schistosoma margrebowiei]|uniref:Uncharacterized protein n=1 Tax=Schistosoma margrebowiei TaxID=48269 RepID=A0A183LLJ0_9TREM|nr:unnamed protein product [Schistosoma margrebowiei]
MLEVKKYTVDRDKHNPSSRRRSKLYLYNNESIQLALVNNPV